MNTSSSGGCGNSSNTPHMGFARPYFYEDCLTQEEINNLPINSPAFDAYSILSYDGNRLVRQWFQPPIVEPVGLPAFAEDFSKGKAVKYSRGVKMETNNVSYDLYVYIGENETPITLQGGIVRDMIYDKNPDKSVAELSRLGRQKNESKYVFWPHEAIDKLNIEVDLEFSIYVSLRLGLETEASAYVSAGVKLDRMKESTAGTWSRNFLSNFKTQLKSKFKNRKTSIDNLVLRHYMDPVGNAILLTFDMSTGSKPRLVDIEFEVPTAALRGVNESVPTTVDEEYEPLELVHYFKCDPKDVDSVVALCMAIDKGLVTLPKTNPNLSALEKCAPVIKQHAHQLQESVARGGEEMDFVSNEVCSSIQAATDILFIDARATASMSKLAERPDDAAIEIEKWERKYKQGEGKGFKNKIQQGKMKVQMGMLKNALKRNKELLRKNGASGDKLNEYQGLIDKIQEIEKR